MTDLEITDGTLLSFDYNIVDFDSNFRFGIRENITVSVTQLLCRTGGAAVEGQIGDQAKALDDLISTKDYIKLTLNGHAFSELFQLTNFTLNDGNWINATEGSLTLQSYRTGNVTDKIFDSYEDYAGWDGLIAPEFIEEFSDDFSFKRGANGISYSHDIKIKFAAINPVNGQHITPPLTAGLEVAQYLILNRPEFSWLKEPELQGLYTDIGTDCKRLITESVDEINSTVSVSESFDAENIKSESDCLYSFSATQAIEVKEDGIINVSENGVVINLKLGEKNQRANPEDCLQGEIVNATSPSGRLQQMFTFYKNKLGADYECISEIDPLVVDEDGNLLLIEKGITRDLFRGKANYSIKATNDQKITEDARHDYVTTIEPLQFDLDSDCQPFLKVKQSGSFTGHSKDGKNLTIVNGQEVRPRYEKAKKAWKDAKEDIKASVQACAELEESYPVILSNSHSPFKGKVSYDLEYSQEPKYGTLSTPYKMWTYSYSDNFTAEGGDCVFQHTLQNVANNKTGAQILQQRNTTELPNSTMNQRMVGKRGKPVADLAALMAPKAEPQFTGGPKTLKDCSYTFNPENDIILDANFTWE